MTKDSKLFKNNKIFEVGRYHSLRLEEPFYSENIKITMRCSKTNIAMGIEDHKNKVFGFQFHPESFLTKNGKVIIKKSYQLKDLKEIPFNDLWGLRGVFTTMRLIGNNNKIVLKNNHIDNLIASAKKYKIRKKI